MIFSCHLDIPEGWRHPKTTCLLVSFVFWNKQILLRASKPVVTFWSPRGHVFTERKGTRLFPQDKSWPFASEPGSLHFINWKSLRFLLIPRVKPQQDLPTFKSNKPQTPRFVTPFNFGSFRGRRRLFVFSGFSKHGFKTHIFWCWFVSFFRDFVFALFFGTGSVSEINLKWCGNTPLHKVVFFSCENSPRKLALQGWSRSQWV